MQSSCACMESKEKSRKYTDNGDSAKKDGKFVNAKLQRNVSNGRCRCCYGGASNADLMLDSTFENEDALQWLVDAGLLVKAELVEKPDLPLEGAADKTYFKVYMSDIGLLRAKSKVSVNTILEETDLYVRYKGAFAENYVLNELKSLGKKPFFWRSGNTAEVDFIYEEESEIVPVEVKTADNTQAKSYRQFCRKYQPKKGLKLSRKNIAENLCESTTTYNIPLYLEWNIDSYIKYN